jgi:cysteine desulfurase/selenocysteine lyase
VTPAAPHSPPQCAQTPGVERVRADFPILSRLVHGVPLAYLDNAATSHKPRSVLDALRRHYEHDNANVHRGVHELSVRATLAYEDARRRVASFLGAASPDEVVFVRGATEAINLAAAAWGSANVREGDDVLVSAMEHHSNIVPWQMLCGRVGARLRPIPINDAGEILLDEYERLLGPRTRLVAVAHVSNALGTINPVAALAALAHRCGAMVLVDGAQAAPHLKIDVRALGADFYAITGHKMFGPTGIGALWARREILEAMPPWQGGGEMILSVSFEGTTYNRPPARFEAGTPSIADAVALAAAVDYIRDLGHEWIARHEADLLEYGTARLGEMRGVRLVGTAAHKASILSFTVDGVHPHDVGTVLDRHGVAVRTGHHCAQPLMDRLGLTATARASLALYNTRGEIDRLVAGLRAVREVFG